MRIVLDCRSVFPGMGGIGRSTAALARALPRAMPEASFFYLFGARRPAQPLAFAENVEEISVDAAMIDARFEQIHLPRMLRDIGADLYHGTCFDVPLGSDVCKVATVHDVVFRRRPELVGVQLRSYLDLWTEVSCATADAVVTPSEFSKREIVALYGCEPDLVSVIPNAVGEEFFNVRRRLPAGVPFLLYVGSLEEKKNIGALLAGFAALLRNQPTLPHQLVLVGGQGGAPYDVEAALAREPDLAGRVRVLGHVPDADLLGLYATADLFCYLSEYEGFGLPPLEAMAAGVPCVVSDRGSLPEVTDGAALLVEPQDSAEVAWILSEALGDETLRETLVEQGKRVARSYSWDASARQLSDVYRSLLSSKAWQ